VKHFTQNPPSARDHYLECKNEAHGLVQLKLERKTFILTWGSLNGGEDKTQKFCVSEIKPGKRNNLTIIFSVNIL